MNRTTITAVQESSFGKPRGWVFLVVLALVSCGAPQAPAPAKPATEAPVPVLEPNTVEDFHIIPAPRVLEPRTGSFSISDETRVTADITDPWTKTVASWLAAELNVPLGANLGTTKGAIRLVLVDTVADEEGYRLTVAPDGVLLEARTARGLFYGAQTLGQLQAPAGTGGKPPIKSVRIEDTPRFGYRGMHLDVSRHFFTVDEVKRFIDLIARYKYNTMHWHLTDDQGWRIEIKKYPKLTEIGGYRKETLIGHDRDRPHQFDGKKYGGFYTQEQIRDVLEYANERFVTVIPEIELPGHALAALSAYPEFGCDPTKATKYEAATKWGIFEDVFCPKDETFAFLENVLSEVIGLFPGEYIHIGGDEVPKTVWKKSREAQATLKRESLANEEELQSYFVRRIEKFLNSKGRKLIGWDEILEGGLSPGATVMSWRGLEGGIQAAQEGHDVIMAPNSYVYFNTYQSSDFESEKPAGARFLPLEKTYSFDPIPDELSEKEAAHVLGGEGCLWSEYIPNEEHLQYMMFPRAIALSEVLWSAEEARDWVDFSRRLPAQLDRLQAKGVAYGTQFFEVQQTVRTAAKGAMVIELTAPGERPIHYTLDGSAPTKTSLEYRPSPPLVIQEQVTLRAAAFDGDEPLGHAAPHEYFPHKTLGKRAKFATPYSEKYASTGLGALSDGLRGSTTFGDGRWLGFWDADLDVTLPVAHDRPKGVRTVEVTFLSSPDAWIVPPSEVSVHLKKGGAQTLVKTVKIPALSEFEKPNIRKVKFDVFGSGYAVRVVARSGGPLPAWHQGAGKPAWLFVDEVVIH